MGMYPGKLGEELDPIEVRILKLYGEGLWRWEIAETLHLSVHTIRKYEARIRRRLGATHTLQAMALAHPLVKKELLLLKMNRAQALGFFNLSQHLQLNAEIEITDQDNYGALIIKSEGRRYKLPEPGGVVELAPEPEAVEHTPSS